MKSNYKDKFNTWERYFDKSHPKHKYQVARHDWFMKYVHGPRLLDIGCSGCLALFLAGMKDNITTLCGIDTDREKIMLGSDRLKIYKDKQILLYTQDVHQIPYYEYFDCIICGETLEHVKDDCKVMQEAYKAMRNEGTLLISVPKDGHLSKMHIRLYNTKSINKLIESVGFRVTEEYEIKASAKGYYLLRKAIKL